jgi:hypothetical protein
MTEKVGEGEREIYVKNRRGRRRVTNEYQISILIPLI